MEQDQEETELQNPFPSPPSHYSNYTSHNLSLLDLLQSRSDPPQPQPQSQHQILADQTDVPDWDLRLLEKPRVDWILEDGHYEAFGDTWYVKETIPSLGEQGGHQLYPADPSIDRRPALLAILRSILVTYSNLTSALLLPPRPASSDTEPEWHLRVEWIAVLAQNIMAAANDLRPVQARENLETMMRRQLELRREETNTLHQKCDVLEAKLAELRTVAQRVSSSATNAPPDPAHPTEEPRTVNKAESNEDTLRDPVGPSFEETSEWGRITPALPSFSR